MNNTRILFWNCQGVAPKRLELIQLIQEKSIDILLLNETHLKNCSTFKIPNFYSYTTNRPAQKGKPTYGGTAIFIHKKFSHFKINISTSSIENTTLITKLGNNEFRLSAVYKSPSTKLNSTDLTSLLDTQHNIIIAGYLNAKHPLWNSNTTNTAENSLANFLASRSDVSITAPTSPTHYPDNPLQRPDILDVALLKTGNLHYQLFNLTGELSSDHTPVIIDITTRNKIMSPPKALRTFNWNLFEKEMKNIRLA